jgi:hypothetical protein
MPNPWPALDYAEWRDTLETLQLFTQIAGKVRLSFTPWINHSWQVPLYVSARGLATSPIPSGDEIFEIEFDFIDHRLSARTSRGDAQSFPLAPYSVAEFHRRLMACLKDLEISARIVETPNELPDPIPFPKDTVHKSYDAGAAHRFWRALVQTDRVLKHFRTAFLGKVSPVHFFWGSFDLAVTRFSGRRAPLHPGGMPGLPDAVAREAYSHEISSAGFWPGNALYPHAAFYSYVYPEPNGFPDAKVPKGSAYDTTLGEFILPYDTLRASPDPDGLLIGFLEATYVAAADLGKWDRAALECEPGEPGKVRAVG